ETLPVKLHAPTQPFGVRISPDEEEQRRRVDQRLNAGIVADADGVEMTVSFHGGHDGASVNLDIVDLLDAIDEVSRHALSQIPATREDVHASCVSRQRHDGLPSRVAGAHDDDLLVATELRFRVRRGIVDAGAFELAETRYIEPAILDTRRDKDGLAADLRTVGECDDANAGVDPETLHEAGHGDARTKFLRLKQCVAHEFRPGYAQGETEVVLDP